MQGGAAVVLGRDYPPRYAALPGGRDLGLPGRGSRRAASTRLASTTTAPRLPSAQVIAEGPDAAGPRACARAASRLTCAAGPTLSCEPAVAAGSLTAGFAGGNPLATR